MSTKLQNLITLELLILAILMTILLPPSDRDVVQYYARIGAGCVTCGHAPYTALFVLWPLALVPSSILWPVWCIFTVLAVWWACRRLNTNPVYVLVSFAMISQLWIGQVDAIILLGLTLAFTADNAYLRGAGLLVASVKPQISLVAMLLILWHDRERVKLLAIPAAALVASFAVWGLDWPLRWLTTGTNTPQHPWSANLYPWALPALLAVFLVRDRQKQMAVALWASALSMPAFAAYSHIVPLAFFAPWWSVPISLLWLLTIPITVYVYPVWLPWLTAALMLIILLYPRNCANAAAAVRRRGQALARRAGGVVPGIGVR